jgi:hypothetical protein
MNQITSEIINEILLEEKAWDRKTRELNYKWVIEAYEGERSYRFQEEVMMPRLLRAHRLYAAFCGATLDKDGWLEDFDLSDALSDQFSNDMGMGYGISIGLRSRPYYRVCYFQNRWDITEWAWEEITKEEILTLDIRPNLVPSKLGQASLF